MIFYMLGLLSYYKLKNKPVPAGICLLFFGVITVPPTTTLFFLINKHWTFQALAFAVGLFCWTFIEYFVRRFLNHGKEKKDHKSHYFSHHINPRVILTNSAKRIFFSTVAVLLTYCSIFFSSYLFPLAGISIGFALYGYMHVWLHKPWASKWLNALQKFHMRHHLGQTEKCFGVTNTLWDRVFNTTGKADKIAGSKSIEFYFGEHNNKRLITHKQTV